MFKEAAALFRAPLVIDPKDIKVGCLQIRSCLLTSFDYQLEWKAADEKGIMEYLVNEKGFNPERVRPVRSCYFVCKFSKCAALRR